MFMFFYIIIECILGTWVYGWYNDILTARLFINKLVWVDQNFVVFIKSKLKWLKLNLKIIFNMW